MNSEPDASNGDLDPVDFTEESIFFNNLVKLARAYGTRREGDSTDNRMRDILTSIYHSHGLIVTRHQFTTVKMIKEDMLRNKTDLYTKNLAKYVVKMYGRMKSQRILTVGIVDNLFNNLIDDDLEAEKKAKYEEIANSLSNRLTRMAYILYTHIAPR